MFANICSTLYVLDDVVSYALFSLKFAIQTKYDSVYNTKFCIGKYECFLEE